VKRWDVATGKELATLRGHGGPVLAVAFGLGGTTLMTASGDGVVKRWDTTTGKVSTLECSPGDVMAFSPGGKLLAVADSWTVTLWDVTATTARKRLTVRENQKPYAAAFTPDGKTLATGTGDAGALRLWDLARGEEQTTLAAATDGQY
jgi:WD40 repeat protein